MATDKELKALMARFKPQSKELPYLERLTHGTPTEWEGILKPQGNRVGSATGDPWFGGEFYATPDSVTAYTYLGDYQPNLGDRLGDIYGFDYDTSQFYDIHKPFDQQTPRVQRAIYNDIRNNPNSLFNTLGESGARKWELKDPRYNQLMDDLYKYGVKGISENIDAMDTPTYVFRKASDVPVGISLKKGNDLIPDLITQNKTISKKPTKIMNAHEPLQKILQGYKKAFDPVNRVIVQNPYAKPALKALGTTLGAIGTAGDALFIGDTLYKSSNFYPENTERDRQYRQELAQGKRNPLVTRGVGMRQEDLELLPNIQVNSDGSPNVTLQGGVNYDDYMLEPLGNDVYVRRKNNNK